MWSVECGVLGVECGVWRVKGGWWDGVGRDDIRLFLLTTTSPLLLTPS